MILGRTIFLNHHDNKYLKTDFAVHTSLLVVLLMPELLFESSNMTFTNYAAWLQAEKANPLVLGPGPTPDPSENEVVIKVAYAAVTPADWKVRRLL